MITLKKLENRIYDVKECIGFDFYMKDEKGDVKFEARYRRGKDDRKEWTMSIVLGRTRDADSQVYNFGYVMPKDNLPLDLIAATGLKYFQLYLKEEIQMKVDFDFMIGEETKGL